jgi:hypothetical protein
MPISVLQHNNAAGVSVSTLAVALANPVVGGSLLIAAIRAGDTDTINTPTDTGLNSYTNIAGAHITNAGNHQIETWYVANCIGGSSFSVTANFGASSGHPEIFVYEIAGILKTSPVDVSTGASASSGTAVDSGGVTPTKVNEFLFGFCTTSGNTGTIALGSGWSFAEFMQSNVNNPTGGGEGQINSTTGTFNATFTLGTSSAWAASIVGFFGATNGGGFRQSSRSSRARQYRDRRQPVYFIIQPAPIQLPVFPIIGRTIKSPVAIRSRSTISRIPGVAATPLQRREILRPVTSTPHGRSVKAAIPGPAAAAVVVREILKKVVLVPKSRSVVAIPPGPAAVPLAIREILKRVVPVPHGRSTVATVAGPAIRPIFIRGFRVITLAALRSKSQVIVKPSSIPIQVKERIVGGVRTIRGARAVVASAAAPAAAPFRVIERLVRTAPSRLGRSIQIAVFPSLNPVGIRQTLKRVAVSPRGRSVKATISGALATPIVIRQRLIRTSPLFRGRAVLTRPVGAALAPLSARGILKFPGRALRGLARLIRAALPIPPPTFPLSLRSRNGTTSLTSHGTFTVRSRIGTATLVSHATLTLRTRKGDQMLVTF